MFLPAQVRVSGFTDGQPEHAGMSSLRLEKAGGIDTFLYIAIK